ncbi:hypoxanthine-guanine phosphoribosyltransferase [Isoalcanivorax beigongshangi]|uniref:Hypoxanthine-guanine phosphoribosyltransferase n=1 Tax=Isoalcanivorax beigongshangi TaxID=3238810 RepID=A0ABV4AG20_9GAMM
MTPEFKQELLKVRAEARLLYSQAQLDDAVRRMATEITARYADLNPLLLTVMNGGVVFAGRLLPELDFPLEVDYLHASRYGAATTGSTLHWRVSPGTNLAGRHVLILDDILDVGATLLAIAAACEEQGALSVATAVLVDKVHDRKAEPGLKADFTGVETEDAYLFGGGMDYKGYWRNAPGIFAVEDNA